MMNERELAIRRNQTHKMLEWVESRMKFIERDIRRAANDMERDRLEEVRRDSVRASVWDSVTLDDSASPFLLEHDVLDYGAVLCGIDKDGVAHVIMPTKAEIAGGRA